MRVNAGERAKTTIDRSKECLLLVVGRGETVVKFLSPDAAHLLGSWYVESDVPLEVVKMGVDGKGKTVLRFTEKGCDATPDDEV